MTSYEAIAREMEPGVAEDGPDPLEKCGLLALTANADLGDVARCLRLLVPLLPSEALERRVIRNKAVGALKKAKIADAARLVDAAFNNGSPSQPVVSVSAVTAQEMLAASRCVLEAPDVLATVGGYVRAAGYAGDTRAAQLVYLALTSRLLDRPVNLFLSGPSAGGKNFTVRAVLPLFPPEAYYATAGMSPLAPMYSEESFSHRTLLVSEASAFHEDGIGASLLRALAWDAELKYDTVIDGKALHLHKAGPTGLITTGTRRLEAELATRLWTVPIPDNPEHTRAVLEATAVEAAGSATGIADVRPWVAAQRWLAAAGERRVVIPFATALARLAPAHEVRMRRDFTQLLTLVRVHAFLHQRTRGRDGAGRIAATMADYAAVHAMAQPIFSASLSGGLTPDVRAVVRTVADLTTTLPGASATVSQVAERVQLPTNTCWRRIRIALEGRWLVNDEQRKYQAAKLRIGEPLPDEPGLPTPAKVQETWKRHAEPLEGSQDARFHESFLAGGEGVVDAESRLERAAIQADGEAPPKPESNPGPDPQGPFGQEEHAT